MFLFSILYKIDKIFLKFLLWMFLFFNILTGYIKSRNGQELVHHTIYVAHFQCINQSIIRIIVSLKRSSASFSSQLLCYLSANICGFTYLTNQIRCSSCKVLWLNVNIVKTYLMNIMNMTTYLTLRVASSISDLKVFDWKWKIMWYKSEQKLVSS